MKITVIGRAVLEVPDDKLLDYGYSSSDPEKAAEEQMAWFEEDSGTAAELLAEQLDQVLWFKGDRPI